MKLTMTTMQGLEEVLERELKDMGATDVERLHRAVQCEGDLEFMHKANLCLRTALRVLKPIHQFQANDEKEFYQKVQEVKWPDLFKINQQFAIHAVVNSEVFTHSRYMALKAKDAIVDQFRDIFGRRPNVSTYDPDLIVNIHINNTDCTLSLDSSGESLHKRAYKVAMHEAPLNEVLAAGILMQSGFQRYETFHDPMCGSGTFLTEAIMIHTHCPANLMREDFAFMKWPDFEITAYNALKEKLKEKISEPSIEFSGADIDRKVMFAAKKNVVQVPFGERIQISKKDFFKDEPSPPPAFLVMNPPYDVRLEEEDINQFYADIGTKLKHSYVGSRACLFTGNLEALKKVGLRPDKKMRLMNGAIPSMLHIYDLFEGKRVDTL
jgi:putative N6-adenine-specific DNA methylase